MSNSFLFSFVFCRFLFLQSFFFFFSSLTSFRYSDSNRSSAAACLFHKTEEKSEPSQNQPPLAPLCHPPMLIMARWPT